MKTLAAERMRNHNNSSKQSTQRAIIEEARRQVHARNGKGDALLSKSTADNESSPVPHPLKKNYSIPMERGSAKATFKGSPMKIGKQDLFKMDQAQTNKHSIKP